MPVVEYGLIVVAVLGFLLGTGLVLSGAIRRRKMLGAVGVACLAISALLWQRVETSEFWLVDRCLDSGGEVVYLAWGEIGQETCLACEYEDRREFVGRGELSCPVIEVGN